MRRRFPDARHHCYAFSIGHGASVTQGMSDDGEPSGTAGRPILGLSPRPPLLPTHVCTPDICLNLQVAWTMGRQSAEKLLSSAEKL